MGTAYTGAGISHKYDKLIASASQTFFLKCPPTNAISNVLNEAAAHYVKRGYDIDRFMDPVQPDKTDAIYVKGPNVLFFKRPIQLHLNQRISAENTRSSVFMMSMMKRSCVNKMARL